MAAARTAWLRLFRAGVFVGVILMVHRGAPPVDPDTALGVSVDDLRQFFPAAVGVSGRVSEDGAHFVLDAARNELGFVVATSPDSDDIIGYSGPNNVLVAFGADGRVLGISILSSGDTPEHLADVVADEKFVATFDGKTWEQVRATSRVDGVSGATLTSLAIAEGIIRRVAGSAPSLRFPKPLEIADARKIFPTAAGLSPSGEVLDGAGGRLGKLLRTSPHSDNVVGYGGPTDVLVGLGSDSDTVVGIAIRETYDTEKYVGWVEDEAFFMEMFNGKSLAGLASFDLEDNEVEGVSGATMTSLAVAQAVVELAKAENDPAKSATSTSGRWTIFSYGSRGIGTILVVVFGLVMAFTRLRGVRPVRIAFQLVLIGYLGLINGDLLSQALLVGWAQNGLAWRFAPGMLLLAAAAILVPLAAGKQVYCHQLCPHGAAQQLLKNLLPKKWRSGVPKRGSRWCCARYRSCPAAVRHRGRRAPAGFQPGPRSNHSMRTSSVLPAGRRLRSRWWGLVAALFVPMAYCRYGCPTGAMLNFLWGGGTTGEVFASRRAGGRCAWC